MYFDKLIKPGGDFLGVKYPLICGAMTWVSDFEMVRAVSQTGAFGVLAGGNLPPDIFEKEIDRCVAGVEKPFAVNLITIAPNFRTHYEILQNKRVPFVVFGGGIPRRPDIEGLRSQGIRVMSFAPEESIARQQIEYGVDALILEGSEAGGHIGYVSLIVLLQQVLFKIGGLPVFVGGGVADGRMIAHLLLMGAAGVQMGTRFVLTDECCAHPDFKKALMKAKARQAIATPQYDSKLPVVAVRAVKNKGTEEFGKLQMRLLNEIAAGTITREKAQYEVEKFWIGALRRAVVEGNVDFGSLMAGQSVGLINEILPIQQMVDDLMKAARDEIQSVRQRLCGATDTL
ncbi:MAG: nitronate monooxygenase [Candidatus Marinimicrobia bacterium]|nr:nitronate monooxygenase [Candidatus Neomarinimicrobiota bacterium]